MRRDVVRVDDGATVLVVDGFGRTLRGSFAGKWHDFVARVGAAVPGGAASTSNDAVREGLVSLGDYATVVWLLGDESTGDTTFDSDEQALASAYVSGGGRLVVSGSEIAWDLDSKGGGPSFLASLGAGYAADDAGTFIAAPAGTVPPGTLSGVIASARNPTMSSSAGGSLRLRLRVGPVALHPNANALTERPRWSSVSARRSHPAGDTRSASSATRWMRTPASIASEAMAEPRRFCARASSLRVFRSAFSR